MNKQGIIKHNDLEWQIGWGFAFRSGGEYCLGRVASYLSRVFAVRPAR